MHWVLATIFSDLLKWFSATVTHPVAIIAVLAVVIIGACVLMVTFAKQSPTARRDLIEALRVLRGRK